MPAWEYTSGRTRILDMGRPAHFASRATRKYRGKNTRKTGISRLHSPQLGYPHSWLLPRSLINTGKERKIKNNHTDRLYSPDILCLQGHLLPGRHVWLTDGGGGDHLTFSYNQTWQFPTQGSSELTSAESLIPQVESNLWVLVTETMGRGQSVQSLGGED